LAVVFGVWGAWCGVRGVGMRRLGTGMHTTHAHAHHHSLDAHHHSGQGSIPLKWAEGEQLMTLKPKPELELTKDAVHLQPLRKHLEALHHRCLSRHAQHLRAQHLRALHLHLSRHAPHRRAGHASWPSCCSSSTHARAHTHTHTVMASWPSCRSSSTRSRRTSVPWGRSLSVFSKPPPRDLSLTASPCASSPSTFTGRASLSVGSHLSHVLSSIILCRPSNVLLPSSALDVLACSNGCARRGAAPAEPPQTCHQAPQTGPFLCPCKQHPFMCPCKQHPFLCPARCPPLPARVVQFVARWALTCFVAATSRGAPL